MRADIVVFVEETGEERFLGFIRRDDADIIAGEVLFKLTQHISKITETSNLTGFWNSKSSTILQMM